LTFSERLQDIRTGFERPFWVANISELFERLSYYAVFAVLARYLHEQSGRGVNGVLVELAGGSEELAHDISVHIAYGFMYLRKLDLQIGTSASGQARFIGLPDRTKQGLFFRASEGGREGTAFVDPANTCKADLTITLEKKPQ